MLLAIHLTLDFSLLSFILIILSVIIVFTIFIIILQHYHPFMLGYITDTPASLTCSLLPFFI